jgi:hypothetical protein
VDPAELWCWFRHVTVIFHRWHPGGKIYSLHFTIKVRYYDYFLNRGSVESELGYYELAGKLWTSAQTLELLNEEGLRERRVSVNESTLKDTRIHALISSTQVVRHKKVCDCILRTVVVCFITSLATA